MSDTAVLGALDGVRVVDLTQMLAGPYCTMLLADQGAEVIKVEPLDGDHTRIIGPYHIDDKLKAFGGYFASVNRNKKSIAIDLKTEAGRELVLKLCDNADAVVENYRGGVMDRLDGFLVAAVAAAALGLMRGGVGNPASGLLVW